jgi:hypothetical protein
MHIILLWNMKVKVDGTVEDIFVDGSGISISTSKTESIDSDSSVDIQALIHSTIKKIQTK